MELGVAYRQLNNIELAVQEYTLANTYNPSDPLPDLYTSRAWAYVGQLAKAVQSAEDAVRDAPTDPYMRGNLAYMLYENFQWSEADQQYILTLFGGLSEDGQTIPSLPISADPWVARYYYTYALLLADLGRCAEVLSLTQVIMAALPSDDVATFNSEYALAKCENQPTAAAITCSLQDSHPNSMKVIRRRTLFHKRRYTNLYRLFGLVALITIAVFVILGLRSGSIRSPFAPTPTPTTVNRFPCPGRTGFF